MKKRISKDLKKNTTKKASHKKKAFKEDIQKVVKKAKDTLLNKISKSDDANSSSQQSQENATTDVQQQNKQSKRQSEASMTFFYTSDKYFSQFDDNELLQTIQQKYPDFMADSSDDVQTKKAVIQLIQDKKFVTDLMQMFNLSLQDFFKFIFRSDLSIFKGPFLNKLHKLLVECKYDI